MISRTMSPVRLTLHLAIYFAVLIGLIVTVIQFRPDVLRYLPIGGTHALSGLDIADMLSTGSLGQEPAERIVTSDEEAVESVRHIILFLIGHLTGTVLVMIPITWTYKAMNFDVGYSKSFVRALIVLPICATTIVLLIQDSLALAFGLAALVAAVRFRVSLDEAMDGIFIFAAVCVGLAAGIGYLGVAVIMGVFFCFGNLILWHMNYGQNPLDDAKQKKRRDKLDVQEPDPGTDPQ
jgi:hypothetical protein